MLILESPQDVEHHVVLRLQMMHDRLQLFLRFRIDLIVLLAINESFIDCRFCDIMMIGAA